MHRPQEPLELAAGLARRVASGLCRKDPASREDCSWYHGLWLDLRAIGLAATAQYQADFFLNAFQRLAGRKRPLRVLISGSADYSIQAHVLWACNENAVSAAITVIDLCETPLFLNRWYAGQVGCHIQTDRADLFEYEPGAPFDVICSHGFLSQFTPDQRKKVAASWSRLLSPEGIVLAVNRVRPAASSQEIKFSEQQAAEFCRLVEERIRERPSLSDTEFAQILDRTRVYVRRLRGFAITRAEIERLFNEAGFRVEVLSSVTSADTLNAGMSGPAIPTQAEHACIIAAKVSIPGWQPTVWPS